MENDKQIKIMIGDTVFVDVIGYGYETWKRPFIGKIIHIRENLAIVKAITEPNMLIENEYGAFVGEVRLADLILIK